MDSTLEILGALLGTGFLGGWIGSWLQFRFNRKLNREAELLLEKRRVYNEMAMSLRIFVGQEQRSAGQKAAFLSAYDAMWLWAPDSVLKAMNHFLDLQQRLARGEPIAQEELRRSYSNSVVAMRKTLGFQHTEISAEDYQFVQF